MKDRQAEAGRGYKLTESERRNKNHAHRKMKGRRAGRRKWLVPADALLECAAALSYIGAAAGGEKSERERRERESVAGVKHSQGQLRKADP